MESSSIHTSVGQHPVTRNHRKALIALIAGLGVLAIVLIVALSKGSNGNPTHATSQPTVSTPRPSSYPNGGPADGTPSAVAQALGTAPARGYSLSTNVPAPSGAPISGVDQRLTHLSR
jgi:hypothetical protein